MEDLPQQIGFEDYYRHVWTRAKVDIRSHLVANVIAILGVIVVALL
jgi:hypothetical protein